MKITMLAALLIFCSLICPAQKADEKAVIAARQKILKKQILADDLDYQVKNIPLTAVRVFVRTRLAEWLWKDGKDETGRAELLAGKAVEEIYEKADEMPDSRSLKAGLFNLLDINAKETAAKLRAKYHVENEEDLYNSSPLINKKGGDKILAEKIKQSLGGIKNLAGTQGLIMSLRNQKSPEFVPVLYEIINTQESGRNNFSTASFLWIADNFRDSTVPNDLRIRFYNIVLGRAKSAMLISDGGEIHFADTALFMVLPDIAANAPELAAEANGIKSILSAKNSQKDRDYQESYQRIADSTDKLEALISEAHKTFDKGIKYNFLIEASKQASKEGKFKLSTDLTEETMEDTSKQNNLPLENRISAHDQQLGFIIQDALQKKDVESAEYAAKKIINDLKKADAFLQIAYYFFGKKDVGAASDAYDEAFKLVSGTENEESKIRSLLNLFSLASSIDQSRISEITLITAKAINTIPSLNPEDKPGTANFKKYVSGILQIDFILYITVSNLSRKNKNEAINFASQINRKEIRIAADLALTINSFEPAKMPDKK